MSALQTCPRCGAVVSDVQWNCGACGAEITKASTDTDRTVQRATVPAYPPPSPVISGIPPTAWPTDQDTVSRGAPPAAASWQTPRAQQVVTPAARMAKLPGSPNWIPRAAIALAILGTAGLVWLVIGRGDDPSEGSVPSSSVVGQTTLAATSTVPPTTIETTSTLSPPTIAVTPSVELQPAPPPPAFAVPEVPVFAGPGVAYFIADPLPSGLSAAEVQPALAVAQNVADLLASDQWDNARDFLFFYNGETKSPTVEALVAQWGTADRLSLILVNATKDPSGAGYNMAIGTVANLNDGTTTVICNHVYAEGDADPVVVDLGNAAVVSQGDGQLMPEQILNAPERVTILRARCG